jgi:hypothetical protein
MERPDIQGVRVLPQNEAGPLATPRSTDGQMDWTQWTVPDPVRKKHEPNPTRPNKNIVVPTRSDVSGCAWTAISARNASPDITRLIKLVRFSPLRILNPYTLHRNTLHLSLSPSLPYRAPAARVPTHRALTSPLAVCLAATVHVLPTQRAPPHAASPHCRPLHITRRCRRARIDTGTPGRRASSCRAVPEPCRAQSGSCRPYGHLYPRGRVRPVVYNDNNWRVVAPAPYIG